jgi:hypothetical protein
MYLKYRTFQNRLESYCQILLQYASSPCSTRPNQGCSFSKGWNIIYSLFHPFMQDKLAYGSSVLSLSQFWLLPKWPIKTLLATKVVKIDLKIIILLPWSKSVKFTVCVIFCNENMFYFRLKNAFWNVMCQRS